MVLVLGGQSFGVFCCKRFVTSVQCLSVFGDGILLVQSGNLESVSEYLFKILLSLDNSWSEYGSEWS